MAWPLTGGCVCAFIANCIAVHADTSSAAARDSGSVTTHDIGLLLLGWSDPATGPRRRRYLGTTDSAYASPRSVHQVLGASRFRREKRRDQIGKNLSSISYSNCQLDQSAPSHHVKARRRGDCTNQLWSPSKFCQARHGFSVLSKRFGSRSLPGCRGAGSHLGSTHRPHKKSCSRAYVATAGA
jgi:hypothetical protein